MESESKQYPPSQQVKILPTSLPVPNNSNFVIPEFGQIRVNPFPRAINKRILTSPQFLSPNDVEKTFNVDYIKEFQFISGSENLFPILLQVTTKNIYVCSKDCFVTFAIEQPTKYEKIKLPQMPTCFKATGDYLYFGLKSGSIIIYNIVSKNTVATCQQFQFPVLQIQIVNKDKFLAMDSQGNIKLLSLSFKTFMDRVVKVSSSANFIIQQFRIKKRDKLKNFVKNLPFRKQKDKTQQSQQKPEHQGQVKQNPQQKQMSKFAVLPENLRRQETFPLIYYHNCQLKSLTLDKKINKIAEFTILQNQKGLGMLQLGQGAFQNSNQAHIVLVLSINNTVYFYRQINVQNCLQFIQISKKQHESSIYNGKFISNNLLIFLTQTGIQISNVNGQMQLVHRINYDKFSYIDFFNEQQGFNFDKRLLYPNILKIADESNGNGLLCCLEGKRIILGHILSWKNYLSRMADQYQWQKCMKCALMIYKDIITLLGDIPQSIQERNVAMNQMFQKITLSYLSYSLKNIENMFYRTKILKHAIDFLVRTQSFNFLFTTVFQVAKSYGLEQIFMQQLEQYIQSGSIKYITQQILLKVISHYTLKEDIHKQSSPKKEQLKQGEQNQIQEQKNDKMPIITLIPKKSQLEIQQQIRKAQNRQHLQTMIMNFDLNKMQKPLLLTICLNNQLYRSLIHICRQQADYITPILKLCGLRIVKMSQLQKLQKQLTTKPQQQAQQNKQNISLNSHRVAHLQHQLRKITQITFYYLYECLMGHMTEHNNTKAYVQMLEQLIGFIFIPSTLIMLMQASSKLTFKVFNYIFGAQIMQYILQNEQIITIKNCKYITSSINNTDPKLSINQLITTQLYLCSQRYAASKIKPSPQIPDYSIFNISSNNSQQFTIYNKMLTIITHTILQNYKLYHKGHIIRILPDAILLDSKELEEYHLDQQVQSELYLHQCYKFIAYLILSNSFPVRLGYRILVFQFMLAYPYTFNSNTTISTTILDDRIAQVTNSTIMRIVDSIIRQITNLASEHQEQQKQKLIEKMLQILLQIIDELTICSDWKDNKKELFVPIKCYILDKLNRHSQLINALLGSTKDSVRKSVFSFFQEKINSQLQIYQDQYSAASINGNINNNSKIVYTPNNNQVFKLLINNIQQLILTCKDRLLVLLTNVCEKLIAYNNINIIQIINIVNQLKKQPNLELAFIQNMIKAYEKLLYLQDATENVNLGLVSKNNQMLAVRHLEAVVTHKKQYLQQYILKMNYPLEQAYKVCEQSNNKTAMAYILIKSGRNLQGVQLICDLFIASSRQVFRDLAKNIQTNATQQTLQKMDQQLNKVLQTCYHEYNNDVVRGQQMWEKVSEKLFRQLKPQKVQTIPIPKIKQLLQLYIDKIIKAMFGQVNPQFFVQKFSQNAKMTGIPTKLYLQAHDLVYERLGFKFQINSLTKQLLRQYEMKLYKKLLKQYTAGYALSAQEQICQKCQDCLYGKSKKMEEKVTQQNQNKPIQSNIVQKGKIIVFGCDHAYHSSCLNQIKQEQKNKSGKNNKKLKLGTCSSCKMLWENAIYGELKSQPDKLFLIRQRKKSLLIERKNKLAQFDIYGYFKITGEELMKAN